MKAAEPLNIPLIVKVNVLAHIKSSIREIADSGFCDAIDCSNTIPWGELASEIDWQGIFNGGESPLSHLGGGGLSGKPLLPLVAGWIKGVREAGIDIPIIGGGGVLCQKDADVLVEAGADAVSLGSVIILKPWRIKGIIQYANQLFGGEK